MAQTRISATEKSQGDSVGQEDHGNNLLGLPQYSLERFQGKEYYYEGTVLRLVNCMIQ